MCTSSDLPQLRRTQILYFPSPPTYFRRCRHPRRATSASPTQKAGTLTMSAPSEDFTCLDEPPAPQSTPLACVSQFSRFPTSHYRDELLSRDRSTAAGLPKSSVASGADHPQAIENMVQPRASPRRLQDLLRSASADALVAEEHENESHTQQQAQDSLTGRDRPLLKRRPSLYEDFKKNVYQRLHMFSK